MIKRRGVTRYVGATAVILAVGVTAACSSSATSESSSAAAPTTPAPAASTSASTSATPAVAGAPVPIPESAVVLKMPEDMYLHEGSPTEWWWHTGTLKAGDRTFGFEINAASFEDQGFAFSQIMLTDVANQKHYQRTTTYLPPANFSPTTWAQADTTKDWYARLGDEANKLGGVQVTDAGTGYTTAPEVTFDGDGTGAAAVAKLDSDGGIEQIVLMSAGTGYTKPPKVTITGDGTGATATAFSTYVAMAAPAADPTKDMHVKALLADDPSLTPVTIDLTLSQEGSPFYVWGTGVNPGATGTSTKDNNYYLSLTRLQATGTITVDGDSLPVTGVTWMDHEYGAFGTSANPVKWILQDMQLDNGYSVSNVGILSGDDGQDPKLDVPMQGYATLQAANGDTYLVASSVTPFGETWTSDVSGVTYFTQFKVEIPQFGAEIVVTTLMDAQEFPSPTAGGSVYEGVATAKGTFQDAEVSGTAWIEQTF